MSEAVAKRFAVVGGGMAGMYYAAELRRLAPSSEVHLIESAPVLGGTYGSIRYPGGRLFDFGMHLFYEACDERVDRVLREVLADDEWHFWEGNRKDIAGLYWRGRLQTGSHYVDLREDVRRGGGDFLADLFASLARAPDWKDAVDCEAYFRGKFGGALAEQVFGPAQRKIWHAESRDLDPFAVRMVSSDRVVLYDHEPMLDLMKSEALRARLAVPDQMLLPPGARASRQRALYPRRYGFAHYVDRFERRLVEAGAQLHLGTRIKSLSAPDHRPLALKLQGPDGADRDLAVDHVFWAAPLMQLASALQVPIGDLPMDVPHHIGYVHLLLDKPPRMGELYYFYCYDAPLRAFRVTHYTAYCPGADIGGYAVCAELHYPGSGKPPEAAEAVEAARSELEGMGILDASHRVEFIDAHVSRFGFPRPTRRNRQAFAAIRARIAERVPRAVTLGGVAPDLGRFFLQDILSAAADQLSELTP